MNVKLEREEILRLGPGLMAMVLSLRTTSGISHMHPNERSGLLSDLIIFLRFQGLRKELPKTVQWKHHMGLWASCHCLLDL